MPWVYSNDPDNPGMTWSSDSIQKTSGSSPSPTPGFDPEALSYYQRRPMGSGWSSPADAPYTQGGVTWRPLYDNGQIHSLSAHWSPESGRAQDNYYTYGTGGDFQGSNPLTNGGPWSGNPSSVKAEFPAAASPPQTGSGYTLGQTTVTDGNVYDAPPARPTPMALPPMPSPGAYTPGTPVGQEVQNYLNALQYNSNNSGSGAVLPVGFTDPATQQYYGTGVNPTTTTAADPDITIKPSNYQTTEVADWYPGKQAYVTDLDGNVKAINVEDPNKVDWGGRIALAIITAAAGGAAGAAMGGAGAGSAASVPGGMGGVAEAGFGAGMTGGAAGGTAGGGLAGEVLNRATLDGTTAYGANSLPNAYELPGSGVEVGGPMTTGMPQPTGIPDLPPELMPTETVSPGFEAAPPASAPTGVQPTPEGWSAEAPEGFPEPPSYDSVELPTEQNVPGAPPAGTPPGSTPPAVPPGAPPGGGTPPPANPYLNNPLARVQDAITTALKSAGLTPGQAASLGLALHSMYGSGSDTPQLGNGAGGGAGGGGSGTGGNVSGSAQGTEAAAFLEKVMPYIRYNSKNTAGSAKWSRDASGNYTLDTTLNPGNQSLYDTATSKYNDFTTGLDPNSRAPTLLDSSGYSDALAKSIYDRTMGLQTNTIEEERRKLAIRLAEQGFTPENEGYKRAMNLFQDNLNEAQQKAALDAEIRAHTQGLEEAKFTNESRTQGFKNAQDLQAQLAQILAGTRTNATEGLKTLTSQGSAPSGGPANTTQAAMNQWTADLAAQEAKNSARNDLYRALLNWGLA